VQLGIKCVLISVKIEDNFPIFDCIALIYFDWPSDALMTCFISPESVDCAVLSDFLSSSIMFMLLSSSISFIMFVNPVSREGSSIVGSMFSVAVSDVYGLGMLLQRHRIH
jgi:hypothetical protein